MDWLSSLKQFVPPSVRDQVKRRLRQYRHMRNTTNSKVTGERLDILQIIGSLENLGIRYGDTVIVHASMTRLGLVSGGAPTVLAAIRELVGKNGTVLVPTIHLRVPAVEHFARDQLFDVRSSPSVMGAIAEALRGLPEARRSLHPTHSAAAVGSQAEYLTGDHHKAEMPFGPCSPYYRLGELSGKIILLGVPLANMTNFHVVEDTLGDEFPYPVYMPEPVQARVRDYTGKEFRMTTRIHNPEISKRRRCNEMEGALVACNVAQVGQVGAGRTIVLDAARLNTVLLELSRQNVTMYTPDGFAIQSMLRKRNPVVPSTH
ncbi:MAG TPA: AAC(3) family N-acetyltransferase [Candidatus Kryptonia bacterium]|nr:AAC(3) family N-acetyltransferase [Candidatus Kryptonia bacterium]